jgi:16S rRNA processing protein RimM
VGLEVLNEQGEALGVVKQTFSSGAQDVIEVAGDRTRLIPWVAAVVKEVNLSKKQIHVDWGADW